MTRLSPMESRVLAAFRDALARRFGARLVLATLFGSRARGEGHEDSDLDVLVLVTDLADGERRATIDDAYAIELDTRLCISPLVRDVAAFRRDSALARAIARDGVAL